MKMGRKERGTVVPIPLGPLPVPVPVGICGELSFHFSRIELFYDVDRVPGKRQLNTEKIISVTLLQRVVFL